MPFKAPVNTWNTYGYSEDFEAAVGETYYLEFFWAASVNVKTPGDYTHAVSRLSGGPAFSILTDEPPPAVPEPATLLLLGAGLIGLAGTRRKMES